MTYRVRYIPISKPSTRSLSAISSTEGGSHSANLNPHPSLFTLNPHPDSYRDSTLNFNPKNLTN